MKLTISIVLVATTIATADDQKWEYAQMTSIRTTDSGGSSRVTMYSWRSPQEKGTYQTLAELRLAFDPAAGAERPTTLDALNAIGSYGWELAYHQKDSRAFDTDIWVFKRPTAAAWRGPLALRGSVVIAPPASAAPPPKQSPADAEAEAERNRVQWDEEWRYSPGANGDMARRRIAQREAEARAAGAAPSANERARANMLEHMKRESMRANSPEQRQLEAAERTAEELRRLRMIEESRELDRRLRK